MASCDEARALPGRPCNEALIPGEVLKALISGTEEVLETMRQYGVGITSTGGETADVGDLVRTVIVDSTVASRMPRKARGLLRTSTQQR